MNIFITGTGTNVGKTLISSWLTLHTGYSYFKPIQTGTIDGSDSNFVKELTNAKIYPECYCYPEALSPHLAAKKVGETIDPSTIKLPTTGNLIIEGAGGVLVPINYNFLMIDLIKQLKVPVVIVAHSALGTINHSLLTISALRAYDIDILGVILNGEENIDNKEAIELFGKVKVFGNFPLLTEINIDSLLNVSPPADLIKIIKEG